MSKEEKQVRYKGPYIRLHVNEYLWGTTKGELDLEERAIWIDFLCVGIYKQGMVDITYLPQLAEKLNVPLKVLQRAVKKFEKNKKIQIIADKNDLKKFAKIKNWKKYQADIFIRQRKRITKKGKSDASKAPRLSDASKPTRQDKIREDKKRGEEREENGLPPIPKNLEFKTRDVLIEKRAWVRKLRKLYADKDWERERSERTEEELLEEIREAEKDYCDMVDEYKD